MIRQELDRARTNLAEARAMLASVEGRATNAGNFDRYAGEEREARVRVRVLERRVHELTAQLEAAEAAQLERDRAEQGAEPQLRKASQTLEKSARGLAAAAAAAEEALSRLHRAAAAHSELVEQHRSQVAALGLGAGTRPDGEPHATGVDLRGVRLGGRTWQPVDPGAVVVRAARRAVAEAASPHHPLTGRLSALGGLDGGQLDRLLEAEKC